MNHALVDNRTTPEQLRTRYGAGVSAGAVGRLAWEVKELPNIIMIADNRR